MALPTFTFKEINSGDTALINQAYQFGKDNPTPPEYACQDKPYMLKEEIQTFVNSPHHKVVCIYADGVMVMVTTFRTLDGLLGYTNFKRWSTDGNPHPTGIAQSQFQMSVVKQLSGGQLRTADPMPGRSQYYADLGVEVIESPERTEQLLEDSGLSPEGDSL